jgi:hypothetical protein
VEAIGSEIPPALLVELIRSGALFRMRGGGFYTSP